MRERKNYTCGYDVRIYPQNVRVSEYKRHSKGKVTVWWMNICCFYFKSTKFIYFNYCCIFCIFLCFLEPRRGQSTHYSWYRNIFNHSLVWCLVHFFAFNSVFILLLCAYERFLQSPALKWNKNCERKHYKNEN